MFEARPTSSRHGAEAALEADRERGDPGPCLQPKPKPKPSRDQRPHTVTEDAEASLPGRRRKRTSTSTKATDSSAKAASNRQQRTPSKPNSAERRSTKRLKKYLADEGWLKKKEQMKPKDERRNDERPTAGPTAADPKLPHAADPGGTAAEQPSPHSSEPPEEEADEIMASDDDAPRREPTPPSRRRQSSLVRIPASKRRGGKRGKSKRARPGR